ncbi:MAG: hypothetical protein M0027_19220 [Candidatus Dormibacteraeota bacterium]|nr:hypothetical protein [Candidatus Dormibacteraeota bacterium]
MTAGVVAPPPTAAHSPSAARRLAAGFAELLVQVETDCQRQGCGADCEFAAAAPRVAVQAAGLVRDFGAAGRPVPDPPPPGRAAR